ncbi:MAG: serine hydrolase [Bacteroidales bacterium]|nr:serine hydrolase [Bacteroidales bacterium]
MKKFLFILAFIFLATGFSLSGQTPEVIQKLDAYYEQVLKDWDLPGMAIGIVKDGELVFSKGYGLLEVGKTGTPDQNTLFAIASNTKAFTVSMLAMLVQEGKISWNDPVRMYLPWFEVYDPWVSSHANIRDLLSHRIGLGTFSGDVVWYKSDLTAREIVGAARHLPKAYDFRSGYGYSNLMYLAAGMVIEEVTGKSWIENVQERILDPLGMDRTIVSPADLALKGNFATPHAQQDGKNIPIDWEDWTVVAPMGGLISSVRDVAQWMIFNMNHGIWGQDTLLTAASINMMWTPHNNFGVNHTRPQDFNRHFNAYGLGWGLSDYHGRLSVGHTGGYDGMISEVRMIPDEKLGVVVLTNGIKSPITAITQYTLETMLGLAARDWSAEILERQARRPAEDPRITAIKNARVLRTKPTLELKEYAGTYHSAIYGNIIVSLEGNNLRLNFERSPELSATLSHWHYDVWEIKWDRLHAWFDFGVVKFNTDNKQQVTGMDIEVPNGDIFFEELKPVRVR